MTLVLALLLACGTTDAPEQPEVAAEEPAALAAEPGSDKASDDEFGLPEGYFAMTLLMPADTVDSRIAVGSTVDLIAGEGMDEVLIAKEVEMLAAKVDARGTKVTLALTAEHRARLVGSQLPGQPRVVLHE